MKFEIHFVHKRPRFPAAAAARELPRSGLAQRKPLDHGRKQRSPRSTPCLQQPAAASETRGTDRRTFFKIIFPSSEFLHGEKGAGNLSPAIVHGSREGKTV